MTLESSIESIEARLLKQREENREALEKEPELKETIEAVKAIFGSAHLKYLKVGELERGKDWPPGFIPAKYNKPPKGKGRIQWLRGLEREE